MSEYDDSFERFLDQIPDGASAENREKLGATIATLARGATRAELRMARGRIIDWLRHFEAWMRNDPEAAAKHPVLQDILLRGELLHRSLQRGHPEPGWWQRLNGPHGEVMVERLSGLKADWKARELKRATIARPR